MSLLQHMSITQFYDFSPLFTARVVRKRERTNRKNGDRAKWEEQYPGGDSAAS